MQPETVFSVCNTTALLGWFVLLAGFQKLWCVRAARWLALAFAATYVIVLVLHFGQAEGGFNTLGEVMKLFSNNWAVLGGWIHYLAFDLFVGSWIVSKGQRESLPWWRVLPALPFTIMFGPTGLLLFLALQGRSL